MSARILIVDDNVSLTTLLAKTLAKFGFEPYAENNSVLAFSTIQKLMPDIILLDVMMPEKDGGKVLAEIKSDLSTSSIPVILLTGLAREAQGLAKMFALESQVIGKPVELKTLLDEIEKQLANGRSYNEQRSHESDQLQEQQLMGQLKDITASVSSGPEEPPKTEEAATSETAASLQNQENPFFVSAENNLQTDQPAPPQKQNSTFGDHPSQPDFKGIFSNLPPLEPRPGFGSQLGNSSSGDPCIQNHKPDLPLVASQPNSFSPDSAPERPNTNGSDSSKDHMPAEGRW